MNNIGRLNPLANRQITKMIISAWPWEKAFRVGKRISRKRSTEMAAKVKVEKHKLTPCKMGQNDGLNGP